MDARSSWIIIGLGTIGVIGVTFLLAKFLSNVRARTVLSLAIPATWILFICLTEASWNPFQKLALSSLCLLFIFKACSFLLAKTGPSGVLSNLMAGFVWPGMKLEPFASRNPEVTVDARRFGRGMAIAVVGFLGLLLSSGFSERLGANVSSWLGIASILCMVHLGFSDILTQVVRMLGYPVPSLFDSPWRSTSLSDFWSRRWNLPFIEMNRVFFMPRLVGRIPMRVAVFVMFLISGFLHELAISYPAGTGFGLPMLYFVLQGGLVLAERRLRLRGPLWVLLAVILPVPLLFHFAFRTAIIAPLLTQIHGVLVWISVERLLVWGVTVLGVFQFLILFASFQVPTRLRWRDELPRLSSLNHKLMWTYGSFIVYTIVAFGGITLVLRDEIVTGTRAGLAVSTMIFLFWGLRLATDVFYFRSSDWPEGRLLQIGHVMLNTLFTMIFLGYGAVLGYHAFIH